MHYASVFASFYSSIKSYGPWTAHRAKKQKAHRAQLGISWIPGEYAEDDGTRGEGEGRLTPSQGIYWIQP